MGPNEIIEINSLEYAKMKIDRYDLVAKHHLERHRWLSLLIVYHPFKESDEYSQLLSAVREKRVTVAEVIDLASRDPRLAKSKH